MVPEGCGKKHVSAHSRERIQDAVEVPRGEATDTQSFRLLIYAGQAMLDLLALSGGIFLGSLVRPGFFASYVHSAPFPLMLFTFMVANFYLRAYTYVALFTPHRGILRALGALWITFGASLLITFALKQSEQVSRAVFFTSFAISAATVVVARLPLAWLVSRMPEARFVRRMLIVDGAPVAAPFQFEVIDAEALGIRPDVHNPIMLHNFSRLVSNVDRVVVSCRPEQREHWAIYLKGVGCWGELLVPELRGIAPVHHEPNLGLAGVLVSTNALDLRSRLVKRALDLLFTVPAIVVLSPLLLVIALAIKLDSDGPVLFRQQRMGRGNQLFDVVKFRSMRAEASDHSGNRSASRDDDRITRVGRVLRAASLDELPQLFNVLRGDMSLVGPRPHALGSLAGAQLFWHVDTRYWLRHAIKPGITGLAQVRGFRGATDHEDDLANRLHSDLEYVTAWSISRDIAILFRTLLVVRHKNAY